MSAQESKKKKRPRDLNRLAFSILEDATPEDRPVPPPPDEPEKNPAAVALGRLGGLKGGRARARKLTPEQRSEIARKAAKARWARKDSEENPPDQTPQE